MRKTFIILAIVLQVAILAFIAGKREIIVSTGETVFLRTAPIDPRDMFRGDFVRLQYEISSIPMSKVRGDFSAAKDKEQYVLYAVMKKDERGLGELEYVTDVKPEGNVFYLKGRTTKHWRFQQSSKSLSLQYGIEAYYVEQGKGKGIEEKRGRRTDVQIPMEMEVAVGSDGTPVINGYRWSPIGVGLKVLVRPERNSQNPPRSATVRLILQNVSEDPLALVDLPNSCSFFLEPVVGANKQLTPDSSLCDDILPVDEHVILLQPQEKHEVDFDFTNERWQVTDNDKKVEIGTLEWSERFRIVYRPPNENVAQNLANKDSIWHGHLPSRAFHGGGNVD
jgi:uncharacterized membrane-anchored protein